MWYWIIYSSFSTWNKPWLVTRWQTWHVQSPETCSLDFTVLLGVWLFSWSCICYLHFFANASVSLPEPVTGRISKIRHPQMLGYQKWIPMMWKYFRSFHPVEDYRIWDGGEPPAAPQEQRLSSNPLLCPQSGWGSFWARAQAQLGGVRISAEGKCWATSAMMRKKEWQDL